MKEQLSKASKQSARQRYDKLKAEVAKLEKQNFSRIIAFKSGTSGEWYKIGGNSLLIYYYEVCQKILNIRPNIQADTDFSTTNFDAGVICVRGLDILEKRLVRAEVLKEKRVGKSGVVVFELKISVPEAVMKKLQKDTLEAQEQALAVVRPKATLDPEAYNTLRHLQKRTYEEARKMTDYERAYIGLEAARTSREMTEVYFAMNVGIEADSVAGWRKIYALANRLSFLLNFITDLKIAEVAPLARLWDDLTSLMRYIKKNYLTNK